MKIWILQTGEPLHLDEGNLRPMRAMNLSNKLIERGHEVVLWSSAFDHQNKSHRSLKYSSHHIENNFEIRLIPSPGYLKHIGLARLWDHYKLSKNLKTILNNEYEVPDVAFIGYPPIETAFVMTKWLYDKNIPSILDVKDLWPSLFVEAFPKFIQPLARLIFYPYFFYAKKTIQFSTSISAMAPSFLDWVLDFGNRKKSTTDKVFRLTSESTDLTDQCLIECKKKWEEYGVREGENIIYFAGTFMSVFDFEPILDTAREMQSSQIDCKFVLCGSGDYLNFLKSKSKDLKNITFPGWMEKDMLDTLGRISIASIAPYKNIENYRLNTPNKIVDSLRLGMPILCPLSGEVESLIDDNKVGLRYGDELSLSRAIKHLINNPEDCISMSLNARNLYLRDFEYHAVYDEMASFIEKLDA